MRFLILLAWGLFATAASSQTTPQTPVTEQVTVTVYGPWTHGFRTSDNAEAHLREHPNVYVKSAATAVGSEMDGRPISTKLVSVEFKSKGDASHFPFKARAKVEVTLAPWKINIPKDVAKAEAAAEASGAKPIENELDQRIAELEALDAEMSDAVVDKLTTDLLDKINDIDVMRNTLVSVIARLTSKGPALGLWKGGKTAHRYISRLEETVARVQQVEASLTGLHDHSMRKASSLFDGLLRDLDALDDEIGVQGTWGDGDPDVAAFWAAKDALRDAVTTAEKEALNYDIGMSNEQYAHTFRALKRQDKINELRKNDFLRREYGIDPSAETDATPVTEEALEADQADKARDRLKSQLSPALAPEALQGDPTGDQPQAAPMREAKKQSPLRASSQSGAVSEIRSQAGAATDARTMDAEGAGPIQARRDKETAPRVETPRVTSPFDLARQEKERAAQKEEHNTATLRFNELAWLEIDGQIDKQKELELELFVLVTHEVRGPGYEAARQCGRARSDEIDRRREAHRTACYIRGTPPKDTSEYLAYRQSCKGNWYALHYNWTHIDRRDPAFDLIPYGTWYNGRLAAIPDEVRAEWPCPDAGPNTKVQAGSPLHIVGQANSPETIRSMIRRWLDDLGLKSVEVRLSQNLNELPSPSVDRIDNWPDLTNAPFTLYDDSALKELRDMQQEYRY
ncbi:hypothetical protein [Thalassobius sp. MITS945101]|uniref:hypothetical protein n=1 Tax=Thalassobius sp. MITS945101 TaxID=3096994 RepID=UPI00399ACB4F